MSDKNYRIFLVDDDVKTLIMIKHHLEKKIAYPITVNVFAYGENCLDKIEEWQPDIIVLDYYLNAIRVVSYTHLTLPTTLVV